jgi:hypothetical protein
LFSYNVEVEGSVLARANDGASKAPINVPSSLVIKLAVVFQYIEGCCSFKTIVCDFDDAPENFEIITGSDLVTLSALGSSSSRRIDPIENAIGVGPIEIKVTLTGWSAVQVTKTVYMQKLESIEAKSDQNRLYDSSTTVLKSVGCTGVFQRMAIYSIGTLSPDMWGYKTEHDLDDYVSLESRDTNISTVTSAPHFAMGKSIGTTSIVASFHGIISNEIPIEVSEDKVVITKLRHMTMWPEYDRDGYSATWSGINYCLTRSAPLSRTWYLPVQDRPVCADARRKELVVEATFSDNTKFLDVANNELGINPDELMFISSSDEEAIAFRYTGASALLATLMGNSYKPVAIKVEAYCNGSTYGAMFDGDVTGRIERAPTAVEMLHANLEPENGDVDIGNLFGLALPPKRLDETMSVDIRVNSEEGNLVAVQMNLDFDSTHMRATSCEAGDDWPYEFYCTLNDPMNKARVSAINLDSIKKGDALHLATVHFKVITSATVVSEMNALIQVMTRRNPTGTEDAGQDTTDEATWAHAGITRISLNEGVIREDCRFFSGFGCYGEMLVAPEHINEYTELCNCSAGFYGNNHNVYYQNANKANYQSYPNYEVF